MSSVSAHSSDSAVEPSSTAFSDGAWVGRLLDDRYRIERLLGEGGMGAVFLAEQVKLQKKVALKVILPQFAGNGELAARFAREAMASAKLDHPNVVSALDYGTLPEGGAYLVMQLARGRSLTEVMAERPGDVSLALEVGAQIADALTAAHQARIVHRDLKPDNVVLDAKEGGGVLARVLDFGIARLVDDDGAAPTPALTRVGTVMGTPGYMPPEQALGESVDERADLYALGVILWEIVAGESLFPEEEFAAIVARQLTHTTPPLSSKRPGIPLELEALVDSLLAPKERRTAKAADVRRVLGELSLREELHRRDSTASKLATAQTMLGAPAGTTGAVGVSHAQRSSIQTASGLGARVSAAFEREPRTLAIGLGSALLVLSGALVVGLVTCLSCTGPSDVVATPGVTPALPFTAPSPSPTAAQPPPTPRVAALGADFDIVAQSEDREDREAAASRILADPSSLPLARLAAQLELAEGCRARRDQLRGIIALSDPRALPLLERLDELPRRGCGFLGTGDCHRCLRTDLRDALESTRSSRR